MKKASLVLPWLLLAAVLLFLSPTGAGAQLRAHVLTTLVLTDTSATALLVGGTPGGSTGTGGLKAGAIVGATGAFTGAISSSGGNVSDSVGSLATVRAGGLGLPSQGAGDIPYATSNTQYGRFNGSGLFTLNGAGAPTATALTSVGVWRQIGTTQSGTDSTAAQTTVATIAISGLGQSDVLKVFVTLVNNAGSTAFMEIYNSTDSVLILQDTSAVGTTAVTMEATIACSPASLTAIQSHLTRSTTGVSADVGRAAAFTTNYTGSWTLALRTGVGGTGGDTLTYAIRVYKLIAG